MMRLHVLTALLFATTVTYGQSDAPMGSICGMVQDENGAPASFVKVVAMYDGPHSGPYPLGKTDSTGHYCVDNVAPGDYLMSAEDPEKGYPEMYSNFYSSQRRDPEVHIAIGNLKGHADWRIPYKAGFVEVVLTDARTGKPIIPMFFSLVVQSRPETGVMRGSRASTAALLVPPNENVYFKVSAPGYGEWPADGTKGKLLNSLPGRTERLAIALQPLNQ
jgi:hypothetical protein